MTIQCLCSKEKTKTVFSQEETEVLTKDIHRLGSMVKLLTGFGAITFYFQEGKYTRGEVTVSEKK